MVSASPAATPVTSENLGEAGEALCTAVDCAGVDPAVLAAAVLAVTTFTLVALATFVHITEGLSLLDAERRRTRTERDALERFATMVEGMDASPVRAGHGREGAATLVRTGTADRALGQVREAYRETVMAVPHFEAEYDESLAANMAAEFGEDVATAVASGSVFTPALKRELVRRSRAAADHRATLLRTLAGESRALRDAMDRLDDVERDLDRLDDCRYREHSYDDLADQWQRLDDLEAECSDLLAERQRQLQDDPPDGSTDDGLSFYEYVYEPLSVSFPVVADGLSLLERIRTAERAAVDSLTRTA